MNVELLVRAIAAIHADAVPLRDALNAADRPLGDGDTGMTVEQIVAAWRSVDLASEADVGLAVMALRRAAGQASGSSLGSVLAIGLGADGRVLRGHTHADRAVLVKALGAARETIVARSGAAPGDKTILDSVAAVEQALAAANGDKDLVIVAVTACRAALDDFRARQTRVGRGRLYGEKSIGLDDPGMLAALMLLRSATASS